MARLTDILAGEVEDGRKAADAAAHGRSITGLSGRHASSDRLFGDVVEPIAGERIGGFSSHFEAAAGVPAAVPTLGRRPDQREREPFGSQEQILAWPVRRGYRRYWFNDIPGRIQRAKRAGYEHVLEESGEPISRVTDRADGRGRASYLMEIPFEWYAEDMQRQADALALRLDDIRRGQAGPGAEDNRYVPKQGITITGR